MFNRCLFLRVQAPGLGARSERLKLAPYGPAGQRALSFSVVEGHSSITPPDPPTLSPALMRVGPVLSVQEVRERLRVRVQRIQRGPGAARRQRGHTLEPQVRHGRIGRGGRSECFAKVGRGRNLGNVRGRIAAARGAADPPDTHTNAWAAHDHIVQVTIPGSAVGLPPAGSASPW